MAMANLHDFQTLLSAYNLLLSDLQSTLNRYRQKYQSLNKEEYGLIYSKLEQLMQDRVSEVQDAIEATKQQIVIQVTLS